MKKERYVMIDVGYQTRESWQRGKVIDSHVVESLFDEPREELLVELPGGERMWVAFWKEEASQ